MSFNEALAWSILRSALVAGVCVLAGRYVASGIAAMGPRQRRSAIALAAVPVLTPAILVGYAYYSTALSLVRFPVAHELWYATLLALRWLGVAAAVWAIAPAPPVSPMAAHLRRMSRIGISRSFLFRGVSRTALLAFAVVFMLAMADIETALLMNATGWGTSLFDAQVAGLSLDESLARAARPAIIQLVGLALVLGLLVSRPGAARREPDRRASTATRRFAWLAIVAALAAVTVVPAAFVLTETFEGLSVLIHDIDIHREVLSSLVFAAVSVGFALALAHAIGRVRGPVGVGIAVVCCAPGLIGSLVLSLHLQAAFAAGPLSPLYDTPTPLTLALVALLLPVAIVLLAVRRAVRPDTSLHLTRLMNGSRRARAWSDRIRWLAAGRSALLVAIVLFSLAYFELTASAILAPVSQTPAVVRLYNFMHYGHPPALSAMVALTVLVPVVVGGLVWVAAAGSNRILRHPST